MENQKSCANTAAITTQADIYRSIQYQYIARIINHSVKLQRNYTNAKDVFEIGAVVLRFNPHRERLPQDLVVQETKIIPRNPGIVRHQYTNY